MKLIELKKYFFANIIAILGYLIIYLIISLFRSDNGMIELLSIMIWFYATITAFCLLVLEIIIRNILAKKKSAKITLHINLQISLNKIFILLHSILFYLGLLISILSLLFIFYVYLKNF